MALSIQDQQILRDRIVPLVTPSLIARMRERPEPPFDTDLVEVLDFVRRNPDPDAPRYAIVRIDDGFAVAVRRTPPGAAPELLDDIRHTDRGAAEHAVLEHRLRDYGVTW